MKKLSWTEPKVTDLSVKMTTNKKPMGCGDSWNKHS